MTDLRTQLRGYFEDINPPFDPAELIRDAEARPVPVESPPTRWWSGRRWVYAAAAGIVIAVLIGITAWLIGGTSTDTPPVITQPTTAVTPPPTIGSTETTIPGEASIVGSSLIELEAGVPYTTKPGLTPVIGFVPPEAGWEGTDFIPCGPAMGTLLLRHDGGRMFVVPTADITVDDAVTLLRRGPYENPTVTDTEIGTWGGRRLTGTISSAIEDSWTLGPGRTEPPSTGGLPWLLPYHRGVEDGLDSYESDGGPLLAGSRAEINVVGVDGGILSVALVTHGDSMETFRPRAIALAATLSVDGEPATGCAATPTSSADHLVTHEPSYVGRRVSELENGFEGFYRAGSPGGTGADYGFMLRYERITSREDRDQREQLVLWYLPEPRGDDYQVTDALLLTGDPTTTRLAPVCGWDLVSLVDESGTLVRAWRPNLETHTLAEVQPGDLAPEETTACRG